MSGSLHLVGGGWGGDGAVWRGFLAAARTAASEARRSAPRIAVIAVRDGDHDRHAMKLGQALRAAGDFAPVVSAVGHGVAIEPSALDDVDAVLVGGGSTPAYLETLLPLADRIRELVAAGAPYAGFSAGAAIASRTALVGGWLLDGVPVADQEVAHGLGELALLPGLGLTDTTLDVHAAQWGTLARLVAAVESGAVERGAAIDEGTALILSGDAHTVSGDGNVWWVEGIDGGARVTRQAAAAEQLG
jgi:cyanophycinase